MQSILCFKVYAAACLAITLTACESGRSALANPNESGRLPSNNAKPKIVVGLIGIHGFRSGH